MKNDKIKGAAKAMILGRVGEGRFFQNFLAPMEKILTRCPCKLMRPIARQKQGEKKFFVKK
ncbi:MAG: hypothetical protein SFV22_00715 [Saprospiraceae bacterium]|nr:hypothetical protein [Saprospiraceae bacterium]